MTSCISIQILDTKDHKFWRFFFYWYLISFKWLFVTLRVSDLCTVQSTETPFLDIHVCPVASTCSQITKIYTTRTHIHWPCLCIFHVCVVIPVKVYGDMNFAEKGLDPISSFRYLKIKCLSTISYLQYLLDVGLPWLQSTSILRVIYIVIEDYFVLLLLTIFSKIIFTFHFFFNNFNKIN